METAAKAYELTRTLPIGRMLPEWRVLPHSAKLHFAKFTEAVITLFVEKMNDVGVETKLSATPPPGDA